MRLDWHIPFAEAGEFLLQFRQLRQYDHATAFDMFQADPCNQRQPEIPAVGKSMMPTLHLMTPLMYQMTLK